MARTKAIDFDDKLHLILDTAAELFAEKGFSVATTTDIAVACGMSKSALYHYHKSKEAILYALLSTHMAAVIRQVQDAIDAQSEPRARFTAFLVSLLESNAISRKKNIVLLNEAGALPQAQHAEIKRLEKKLVRIGTDLLKPLNAAVMSKDALRGCYTMFLFGLMNWTYTWYDPRGAMTPAEVAHRIADLFLNGFLQVSAGVDAPKTMRSRRAAGLAG